MEREGQCRAAEQHAAQIAHRRAGIAVVSLLTGVTSVAYCLWQVQQDLCKAALTGGVVATQAAWQEQHGSPYDQQPVYTSMAGEDGSLVMLGEPLATDGDEAPQPKHQEPFMLLDGIPQVLLAKPAALLLLTVA